MRIGEKKLPEGYEAISNGSGTHDVVIKSKVANGLRKKATAEQRADLQALIDRYVLNGPTGLPSKKWNGNEGWFPSAKAAGKVKLEAFKAWKLRVYGFCCQFNGRPTFFITGFDPAKKQDAADQRILAASGAEAVELSRLIK